MNLICQIRNFFHRNGGMDTKSQLTENQDSTSAYKSLLLNLQQVCGRLPEGEAFVTIGDGEFSVSMTWKPTAEATAQDQPLRFSLCGDGKVIEWSEKQPADTKKDTVKAKACETTAADATVAESPKLPTRQQAMMQQLVRFLRLHYAFRYNRLNDRTECAKLDPNNVEDTHHLIYTPVDNRTMNSIALNAMSHGIECWDRDVKRYIESDNAPAYHPFTEYFDHLPAWDGRDRVTELARRVSDKPLWISSFHRWMLAVTAQWMDFDGDNGGKRANAVAPILISTRQGLGKSTFCRMLLPKPLQEYFTESFDLNNASGAENKLAAYGLINIDEFDRLPAARMPQLKNLMQMESLRIRRAYKRSAEPLPRIASFIGTSNRTDLLTDLSGSRRFICVEVTDNIDCTTPLDYEQLYAQLKQELEQGERYWFSKEEEAEIQAENRAFYRVTPAEELVASCFRFAEPGEEGARMLSAADIYAVVKRKNPAALRDCTCTAFSRLLAQVGRRVHTRYGNGYWVASLG